MLIQSQRALVITMHFIVFSFVFATPLSFSRFRGLVSELRPGQEHLAILEFVMNFTTVCCAWIEVMLTTSVTCNEKLTTNYTRQIFLFCFVFMFKRYLAVYAYIFPQYYVISLYLNSFKDAFENE